MWDLVGLGQFGSSWLPWRRYLVGEETKKRMNGRNRRKEKKKKRFICNANNSRERTQEKGGGRIKRRNRLRRRRLLLWTLLRLIDLVSSLSICFSCVQGRNMQMTPRCCKVGGPPPFLYWFERAHGGGGRFFVFRWLEVVRISLNFGAA